MGRKGSRLTEQRLVPFQAGRHVAYSNDRPRALHRVPLCGLILVYTDLDTPVMDGLKRSSRRQPIVFTLASTISQNLPYCADRRVRLNLPSPGDRSSQTDESS